jgi:hypothetical protein
MAKPIGGILFGIVFWSVARRVRHDTIKDYLMVSAYGIILLFTSNQATDLIIALYPPFGLVTVSFMGLSSYMLLIGIYSSAISISQDSKLRQSIRTLAMWESNLLDSIGSAQVEQEVFRKVMPLVKRQLDNSREETGIQSLLTDEDVKQYLDEVLIEVKKVKKRVALCLIWIYWCEGSGAVQVTSSCTQHKNPLCRIEALETAHQEDDNNKGRTLNYDKEKYREMILDSAETVLGIFGFDRPVYGDSKKRRGKWSQELIHEREKDIQTEMT